MKINQSQATMLLRGNISELHCIYYVMVPYAYRSLVSAAAVSISFHQEPSAPDT